MLTAYSDVSVCDGGVAGTAILVSDDMLIDYALERFYGVTNSGRGELLALLLAVRLVDSNFDTPQNVTIYCDCESVVNKYKTCSRTGHVPNRWAFKSDWYRLMEIARKHNITVAHVKAHENERSLNVVCDFAARRLARGRE